MANRLQHLSVNLQDLFTLPICRICSEDKTRCRHAKIPAPIAVGTLVDDGVFNGVGKPQNIARLYRRAELWGEHLPAAEAMIANDVISACHRLCCRKTEPFLVSEGKEDARGSQLIGDLRMGQAVKSHDLPPPKRAPISQHLQDLSSVVTAATGHIRDPLRARAFTWVKQRSIDAEVNAPDKAITECETNHFLIVLRHSDDAGKIGIRSVVPCSIIGRTLPRKVAVLVENHMPVAWWQPRKKVDVKLGNDEQIAPSHFGDHTIGHARRVLEPIASKAGPLVQDKRVDVAGIENINMPVNDPDASRRGLMVRRQEIDSCRFRALFAPWDHHPVPLAPIAGLAYLQIEGPRQIARRQCHTDHHSYRAVAPTYPL